MKVLQELLLEIPHYSVNGQIDIFFDFAKDPVSIVVSDSSIQVKPVDREKLLEQLNDLSRKLNKIFSYAEGCKIALAEEETVKMTG